MPNETPNHGYRRPPEGARDWHIPLNENFSRIDTAVEVRAPESERGEYQPKEGAKFLAVDTGAVYIGDGDQWQQIGRLATSTTAEGAAVSQPVDGARIAGPDDVQSVVDGAMSGENYAKAPTQTVRLRSGETYEIDDTIEVKPNVRFECNGARIVPTGDFNIFELHQGTQLIRPFCDTRDVDWSSAQVVIGASGAGKVGIPNRAWVENAYLIGSKGEGIGIQFRGGEAPCAMQHANGSLRGFDRAIDIYAAGDDTSSNGSWSNGNHFRGRIWNYRIGVSMRSKGAAVSGNFIQLQAQPNKDVSEWLWKMDRDPRSQRGDSKYVMKGNTLVAYPWDNQNYQNNNPAYDSDDRRAPVWFIGRGTRYGNSLWDLSGTLSNEFVVNNSDNPSRNGIFTSHGGFVTGTSEFKRPPIYQPSEGARYHPSSRDG